MTTINPLEPAKARITEIREMTGIEKLVTIKFQDKEYAENFIGWRRESRRDG
mgnify:CR=1 FL=1